MESSAKSKKLAVITFFVGVLVLFRASSGLAVVHMRIGNALGSQMVVYCKANDNAVVGSNRIPKGKYWLFSINPSPRRMIYGCSFTWMDGGGYFTIYDKSRHPEATELVKYHWSVNEDGACLLMDSVGTWQCYGWNDWDDEPEN